MHIIIANVLLFLSFVEYLPDDGRKRRKYVEGLLYNGM